MGTRLALFFLCLLSAHPSPAQVAQEATVRSVLLRAVDASTGVPIPGVIVQDRVSGSRASTDREGQLSLQVVGGGTLNLVLTRDGYRESVHLASLGHAEEILVELTPLLSEPPSGSSSVEGVVTDAETGTPLEGVQITCSRPGLSAVSGSDGEFSFGQLPPGRLRLILNRLGYAEREVILETEEGRDIDLRVDLSTTPIELDPVPVTVDRRTLVGNRDMRSLGASTVVSEFGAAQNVADVLRWHVPGLQLFLGRTGGIKLQIRGTSSLLNQGPPLVILDGMPVGSSGLSWVLRSIHPSQIESIEVLRDVASTSIYGTRGAHGVILINLRRR